MITCNRCGNMNPASAGICRTCGAPLSSKIENEYGSQMGQSPQSSDIPSWLESLKAGERPAKSPSNFDAADLIEEGTLPSWMRSERNDPQKNAAPNAPGDVRPSSLAVPNTDEGAYHYNEKGISAQSLIDEQSLPPWLQGKQSGMGGAAPSPGGTINGPSLIQHDELPQWLKNMETQGAAPPVRPSQPAPAPSARPAEPMKFTEPMPPVAPGFSAKDLIDQQALPSWMAKPDAASPGTPAPANTPGVQPGQAGFSASSLLDADALPSWLQQSGQDQATKQPFTHQPPPQAPQGPPVYNNQSRPSAALPPAGIAGTGGGQGSSNNVSASSFIDMDALPEWLRSASNQPQSSTPQPSGSMNNIRAGSYNVPPRVDNVRVPSRPRTEVQSSEGSEVAANVFASMLGVAAAPNYPPQQGYPQGGQPTPAAGPFPPASPAQPAPQAYPPAGTYSTLGVPQGQSMPQAAPPFNAQPSQPMPGYNQGIPGYNSYQPPSNMYQPQGNASPNYYSMGMPPTGGLQDQLHASMPPMPGSRPMDSEQRNDIKPAKRGLFNAIREWLSPSR